MGERTEHICATLTHSLAFYLNLSAYWTWWIAYLKRTMWNKIHQNNSSTLYETILRQAIIVIFSLYAIGVVRCDAMLCFAIVMIIYSNFSKIFEHFCGHWTVDTLMHWSMHLFVEQIEKVVNVHVKIKRQCCNTEKRVATQYNVEN